MELSNKVLYKITQKNLLIIGKGLKWRHPLGGIKANSIGLPATNSL